MPLDPALGPGLRLLEALPVSRAGETFLVGSGARASGLEVTRGAGLTLALPAPIFASVRGLPDLLAEGEDVREEDESWEEDGLRTLGSLRGGDRVRLLFLLFSFAPRLLLGLLDLCFFLFFDLDWDLLFFFELFLFFSLEWAVTLEDRPRLCSFFRFFFLGEGERD